MVLRRWASGLLPACPARDDVVLVANELASNAIRHTASGRDGWFAVEITWCPTLVRVAVADCGGQKEPVVIEDPGGESGRGLFLVQQLSVGMGTSGNHSGRLVWADIGWAAFPAGRCHASDTAASGIVRQSPGASGGVRQQA